MNEELYRIVWTVTLELEQAKGNPGGCGEPEDQTIYVHYVHLDLHEWMKALAVICIPAVVIKKDY